MTNIFTQTIKLNVLNSIRLLHLTSTQNGQARVMKKIMGGTAKKKFKYCESPLLPTPTTFSKGTFEGKHSSNSKRATVLNKLFMRYITDLMATGECSSAFVGHGIEINRVQITSDYHCVNVYWIARGTEKDDAIENILHKNTSSLRHELAQLKVVGVIPKIKFVKDKQYARAVEVDQLLAHADFGDDYVPVDRTTKLKSQLELNISLEPNLVKQIHALDETETDTQEIEELLPAMPNNVFGLNHTDIMERIQKSKKKSQALHRLQAEDEIKTPPTTLNASPLQFTSEHAEREAFKEFLRKRQILKKKANKLDKNYKPELEYMREQWLLQKEMIDSSYVFESVNEDKDFIEEDEDVK